MSRAAAVDDGTSGDDGSADSVTPSEVDISVLNLVTSEEARFFKQQVSIL